MPLLAADGAILACDKGTLPAPLGVIAVNPMVNAVQKVAAEVSDWKPNLNVRSFGMCNSMQNPKVQAATEANKGVLTPQPCTPNIASAWNPGASIVTIRKVRALHEGCWTRCVFGGTVRVKNAVQTTVSVK